MKYRVEYFKIAGIRYKIQILLGNYLNSHTIFSLHIIEVGLPGLTNPLTIHFYRSNEKYDLDYYFSINDKKFNIYILLEKESLKF